MHIARKPKLGQNYAFIVVAVVFLSLMVSAGSRGTISILIQPLEAAFGWSRETISFGAAVGIFLYGLMGPFAAAMMQSFGVKRVLVGALALMAAATGGSFFMTEPWQFVLTWGLLSGLASGSVALVLGAVIVNRWFVRNRGLMMGILTASTATGALVFQPSLAALATAYGWQSVVLTVAGAAAVLIPLALRLVPERPEAVGLTAYGASADARPATQAASGNPFLGALRPLAKAVRHRDFWLLAGTFFICGFTTNGLVGTHLISYCGDFGIPAVAAAGLVATMGLFDLVGTTASGWLTDRFDPRKLLFVYYGLRGLSLIWLPYTDFSFYSLSIFAVFYGLDWIATVPPTVRLANDVFGERDAPVIFGWVVTAHQLGAASAAFFAGLVRSTQGSYLEAFVIAGFTGLLAAILSLTIRRSGSRLAPAPA